MRDACLREASFYPKVKTYWLLQVLLLSLTIIGIVLVPLLVVIVLLVSLLGVVDAEQFREAILAQKDQITASEPAAQIQPDSQGSTAPTEVDTLQQLLKSVQSIERLLAAKS